MSVVSGISTERWMRQEQEGSIAIRMSKDIVTPRVLVDQLASERGEAEVICWYEGTRGLPVKGAEFYEKEFFVPLYARRQDIRFKLYSLLGWDFKTTKNVSRIPPSRLGASIDQIGNAAFNSMPASSFFRSCLTDNPQDTLFQFASETLVNRKLQQLSDNRPKANVTVRKFFDERNSVFDGIGMKDANAAYSIMQNTEGYALIRDAVQRGLSEKKKKIKAVFALPNDEGKYYLDYFPAKVEKMLRREFGDRLKNVEIDISFRFFAYGNGPEDRPYIDKTPKAPFVDPKKIDSYWQFLSSKKPAAAQVAYVPRDLIHNLNGF